MTRRPARSAEGPPAPAGARSGTRSTAALRRHAREVLGTGRLGRVVLTVVVAVLLMPGAAVAETGGTELVVRPAPGSSVADGGWFQLRARPGDSVSQALVVRNDSPRTVTLELAAVDATTGARGGVSYATAAAAPAGTGAWIDLSSTTLTLRAGGSAQVPFRVTVPGDARGGQHLAGLSVGPSPAAAGAGGSGSLDVRTRRVVAVQVDLPGPAVAELVPTGVSAAARPEGLQLDVAIANTGTAMTKASGTVTVPEQGFEHRFEVDTFVPGTAIAYPVPWTSAVPDGEHPVRVELRDGDRVSRWEGTVRVGEEVRDALADRQVVPPSPTDVGEGLGPVAMAGWSAGGLVLGLLGWYGVRRRRSSPAEPAT